jgi:hypothetical protein
MAWLVWCALAAVAASVLGQLWSGIGPPWRWPALAYRSLRRSLRSARRSASESIAERVRRHRRRSGADLDPFTILNMQARLGALARELQRLEADDADRTYWARAHRIHTRRCAYDQLLVEACKLAGVPGQRESGGSPASGITRRSEEERFRDEMELASRGWNW